MSDWNAGIMEEFRANSGEVGGMFEGMPLLILHTTGARTGSHRETPLVYLSRDERLFVFASKAGAHAHPDWYYNLKASPSVSVEIGTQRLDKTAVELDRAHRDEIYAHQAGLFEQFAEYQAGTERVIPVIELV